jgi:hypothetical protein
LQVLVRLRSVFAGLAAVFCANFLTLSVPFGLVNLFLKLFFKALRLTTTAQISKHRYASNRDAKRLASRSTSRCLSFLFPSAFALGCNAVAWVWGGRLRELLHHGQTLGLRSGLPSAPCLMLPSGLRREACFVLPIQSIALAACVQPRKGSVCLPHRCDFLNVSRSERSCKSGEPVDGGGKPPAPFPALVCVGTSVQEACVRGSIFAWNPLKSTSSPSRCKRAASPT